MSKKQINKNKKNANNENDELIVIKYRPRARIGKCFQAEIPECESQSQIFQASGSSVTDKETRLWDCRILPEDDVKAYVHKDRGDDRFCTSQDRPIRDNENALAVLNNVEYSIKHAEKVREKVKEEQNKDCWTHDEKKLFEAGFVACGKNFAAIKDKFLKHKSVKEVVKYYYHWKISKSSRSFRVKHNEKESARLRCCSSRMYYRDEYIFY